MDCLKKSLAVLLAVSMLILYFPDIGFAEKELFSARAGITKHRPQVVSTPEQDIPTTKVKKTRLWPCCLGLILLGGAAAFISPDEEEKNPQGTGNIGVTW